jgi:hypothetical protein
MLESLDKWRFTSLKMSERASPVGKVDFDPAEPDPGADPAS